MASPFSGFQNLRILVAPSTAPMTLRDGVPTLPPPVDQCVVELFSKASGSSPAPRPSIEVATGSAGGFIVRWAPLDSNDHWLADAGVFSWDDSGLAPPLLRIGLVCRAFLGDLTILPDRTGGQLGELELTELGQPFGVGGIGKLIRTAAGDKWTGSFRQVR